MTPISFSITIPAYKSNFLKECIESVVAQTYQDYQLIILNDNSPEDIDGIMHQFDDSRIKYFKNKENCGAINVVDNWNKCLSMATGDYVMCIGDDDKLCPTCLEEYVRLINKYPDLNIYHGLTKIIDENGNFKRMQEPRPEREGMFSMIYGRLRNLREQFIGDWLIRTQFLKDNGGYVKYPLAWGSDDMTAYLAAKDRGVANSDVVMFQYRENSRTISNTGNVLVKLESINSFMNDLKKLINDESLSKDLLEKYYQISCQNAIETAKSIKEQRIISEDIAAHNKVFRWIWWYVNRKQLNVPTSDILKGWAKSLNK